MNMILQTDRLYMRPFRPNDVAALREVFNDPYARQFYPSMIEQRSVERWIQRNLERYDEDGFGLWALCLKQNSALIGDCGLIAQTIAGAREIEVAYHVRADQRGRGFGTSAAVACLDHGFETIRCERLVSMVHPANAASRAVAGRIHSQLQRFLRLGDRYYLYYTERIDWLARRHAPLDPRVHDESSG